jgi:protein O-GlcNAc transferase
VIDAALQAEAEGRIAEAVNILQGSADRFSKDGRKAPREIVAHLARLHCLNGRFNAVEKCVRSGLADFPHDFDLTNMLGIALWKQGCFDEALVVCERASCLRPDDAQPIATLAHIFAEKQNLNRALDLFAKARQLDPKNREYLRLIATLNARLGRHVLAVDQFSQACRLHGDEIANWLSWAKVETEVERHAEALAVLEQGLQTLPGNEALLDAKAIVLRRAGRFQHATAFLRNYLEQNPEAAWAHHQLAHTLARSDRSTANIHFGRAADLSPRNQTFLIDCADSFNRTRGATEASNIQQAFMYAERAHYLGELQPRNSAIAAGIFRRVGRFDLEEQLKDFRSIGSNWAHDGYHFALHTSLPRVETTADRYALVRLHRQWGDATIRKAEIRPLFRNPRKLQKKLRVGFLSADLRNHPVSYFALPLFDYYDQESFELFCYSTSYFAADDVQRHIVSKVHAFREVADASDRAIAQVIANDALDILFELGAGTDMNKVEVLAYKPAPIQVSWLGYPHSVGLSTIDYIVTDPYTSPPDSGLNLEKPFALPHTWVSFHHLGLSGNGEIASEIPQDRNGYLTFGTANNPFKYTRGLVDEWARIVANVKESRFLFVRPEAGTAVFRNSIRKIFAEHGISPDRVQFQCVRGNHLRWYNQIDISLDTFPQTGGTTTCESLWMGVPVITLVGEAFFERISYSNLSNCGLFDLCTFSRDEYHARAISLANDPARRRNLKQNLRRQIGEFPLGNPIEFTRRFYELIKRTVPLRST